MITLLAAAALAAPVVTAPKPAEPSTPPSPDAAAPAPAGPDRTHPPAVAAPPVLELPEPVVHTLAPGVEAWHVQVPGLRKVAVEVVFDRGMIELLRAPDMIGRGSGWLADAAAGDLDGAEFSERCDLHEAEVYSRLGLHDGGVSLSVPREELPTGLELATMVLRDPEYPKQEVKRWILDQRQYYLVDGPASPQALAGAGLAYGWFPANHPYGARPDLAELEEVDGDALDAVWARVRQESPVTVVVVGDVTWEQVEPALKTMTAGIGKAGEAATELLFDPPTTTRLLAVDLPGQAQASIRARLAAPVRDADDQAEMTVANFVLGGHFLSRLNANLREEKGWTYGAGSRYQLGTSWGHVTVSVDVKTENAGATITEIERELARLATEPVTAEELESAHRSLVADWNRTLENAGSASGAYLAALDQHTTAAGLRERQQKFYAVTAEELQAAAAEWLGKDAARLWVVVGDRKALEPQLAGLGVPVEWVAATDMVLGKL